MPHINRIRVNNVKYNFGTQYYDDFIMRFSGKNTIYDLANGGGKSVLMLLLLQNLIPNCTLDEKQPIEKLFRQGNGNTTIHSLIEWKLNPCHVKNGFQYMTTGFCARKARGSSGEEQEGAKETASIEYFNYCIFYRQFNDNDMRNLPLQNGKERITYLGLRSYLQELEKKDFHVEVQIFDRKGDYQRFISRYGLFESEWEIIRGINKTEGHVRTYFETNYRTTRKVVEDLLIEEIIEKSFYHKTGTSKESGNMAQTLLELKDQLILLSQKKNEIHYYDRQKEVLLEFAGRVSGLQGMYTQKKGLEEQLVKTYNTTLKRHGQKEHAHEALLENREVLEKTKAELLCQMETAQVQSREALLESLEEDTQKKKRELAEAEEQVHFSDQKLRERESDNAYLSFLEAEKEYSSAKSAVTHILNHSGNLEQELLAMASEMKGYVETEKKTLLERISTLQEKSGALESEKETASKELHRLEVACEVQKHTRDSVHREREEYQSTISLLAKEENLLFFSDPEEQYKDAEKTLAGTKKTLQQLEAEKEKCQLEILKARMDQSNAQREEKQTMERLEKLSLMLADFAKDREHMDQLILIYGGTYESIENILFQQIKELCLEHQRYTEEQKRLQSSLTAAADGLPVAPSPQVQKFLEDIGRYYDEKAILGYTYLKRKNAQERELYLERYPMLPYAVVTSAALVRIAEDRKFRERDFGDALIPVLSLDALEKEKELVLEDSVIFAGSAAAPERQKERLAELEKLFARAYEKDRVLKTDYDFIQGFLQKRRESVPKQEEYDALKGLWKQQQAYQAARQSEAYAGEQQLGQLAAQITAQLELVQEQEHHLELAGQMRTLEKQRQEAGRREEACRRELASKEAEQEALKGRIFRLSQELGELYDQTGSRQQELDRVLKSWEAFRPYDDGKEYQKSGLSRKELEIEFLGRREAFERENSDVADKQKLAASYEKSMDKQTEALQLLGISAEEMAERFEKSGCIRTGMEELLILKQEAFSARERKLCLERELKALEERLHKTQGSIQHARQTIEETYGSYEKLDISGEQLELFVRRKKEQLRETENRNRQEEKTLRELEEQCYALKAMAEDMKRMMKAAQIEPEQIRECLETGMSLKEQYEDLRSRYEKIVREEAKRLEEFETERQLLTETLEKLGAYELAAEIKKNIRKPENEQQIAQQVQSLKSVVECLELEKARVEKDMDSLQDLKDQFETQCLQNCLNMKEELDRLPKLSKISMDQQMISMITLQIPYLKEELYQDAMSRYIDQIISQVEKFETQTERLNFIRSQLAFKRLFAVIVTNMDAIRLTLYKRERMKEQSRYLRYEEAVGSTGQSQGIYIQFLVAIINYISSINSGNADPLELKKVIFIDNPFGAAKDIYIWEPIFKLLRANNVQLIVPARGATPAITGHFEVNYILGQKLIDGRQQTVVVDYRSQTEEKELEYETIEFEQTSLFSQQ